MEQEKSLNTTVFTTTSVIGVLLAIACFEHGLFETLQGYKPTSGYIIQAIGENIRWWPGGTEEAFTIIPNYLVTGILVIVFSVFAALWSMKYIKTGMGSAIFLLSFVILTLLGGGIGHIPFYVTTWAFLLKGKSDLLWWRKRIRNRDGIEKYKLFWKALMILINILWLLALEIAIFGYFPGVNDENTLLAICWGSLLLALVAVVFAYISAMVIDIKRKLALRFA